jgi:hypothetical protein
MGQHRPDLGIVGVHFACPIEVLHWVLLGRFKYIRTSFFDLLGQTSDTAERFNTLASLVGTFLHRQSDRNKPRTTFSQGVQEGKLMAHEMRGVLLVIAASLRTTKGRNLLMKDAPNGSKAKAKLGNIARIREWIELIELWLYFDAWLLKTDGHSVHHLGLLKNKVKELMQMEKAVGKREKGMKYKTFKFHATLHVADDILHHGSPVNVDTMSDEMHHKSSKTAAGMTQKQPKKFECQVAGRLHEQHALDIGLCDIEGKKIWEYFSVDKTNADKDSDDSSICTTSSEGDKAEDKCMLTGVQVLVWFEKNTHRAMYRINSRMKDKDRFQFDRCLVHYLCALLARINSLDTLVIYTEHQRYGQTFRASPYFMGKSWRDWAMIEWIYDTEDSSSDAESKNSAEDDNYRRVVLPFHFSCFVDLRDVDPDLDNISPGMYAIGEYAEPRAINNTNREELEMSSMFTSYTKKIKGRYPNNEIRRDLMMVDCDTIKDTALLIPDIDHNNVGEFLHVLPRNEWAGQFERWLETPHNPNAFRDVQPI